MTTQSDELVDRARSIAIEDVIARHGIKLRRSGQERIGPCPKCGGTDRFSINVKDNVWNCRGCKPANLSGDVIGLIEFLDGVDFTGAIEKLTGEAFTPHKPNGHHDTRQDSRQGGKTITDTYDYTDAGGALRFQVVRLVPKDFRQRRLNGTGDWIWNLDGITLVPYRLPELIEAIAQEHTIFIVEGEKDVDNLRKLGVTATCNPRGAGKWANCKIDDHFSGALVVIIADNDPASRNKKTGEILVHDDGRPRFAGWDHAQEVAQHLSEIAISVRVIDLKKVWSACPDKGDISDWIAAGGTIEALHDIVEQTPEWQPGDEVSQPAGAERPRGSRILGKSEFRKLFTPPDYLVHGVLQRGFVYALTGPTSHAKSAIALLLAELVACPDKNSVIGTHRVEKGRVLYFVGENPIDICMRVIGADSKRTDDPSKDEIFFISGRIEIKTLFNDIVAEVNRIGPLDLVIVDTSAAYFFGDDENQNKQIGEHARMLRDLTTLPGRPCVLVLCHPIKHAQEQAQLLPRGGGAFLAEMDGNLTVWKRDDLIELHYTKMRGPGFEAMNFRLELIETTQLLDSKGNVLPTVRAIPVSRSEEQDAPNRQEDDENLVLTELMADADQTTAAIAERLGWHTSNGEPSKSRVWRAIQRLEKASPKLIKKNRNRWELTDEGKKIAVRTTLKRQDQQNREAQKDFEL